MKIDRAHSGYVGAPQRAGLAALSPREAQVAHAVARGASNREIADQLGLAEGTVKQYLKRIFRTLHVANRTQLALRIKAGEPPPE